MFGWLRNLFSRKPQRAGDSRMRRQGPEDRGENWTLRRWESAETNRLNAAHWARAIGRNINSDLADRLQRLWDRCSYEVSNNPMVEGVITTHATDLVGPNGPTLQVVSDNDDYNDRLELGWHDWAQMPDVQGILPLADMLHQWVRNLWTTGEFLAQEETASEADAGPVRMRLHNIDPRRLWTPHTRQSSADVILGIRFANKRPATYWINDPEFSGPYEIRDNYNPVPADLITHGYQMLEAGQVRGAPWLAPSLDVIAELRDFDAQVLDAQRMAADMAVYLYTKHADANYVEVNEETEIRRRMISTVPPGWEPFQLKPEQPSTQYVEYRAERFRELGRPVNMPLMAIQLDSSRHNYSSARFDGQVYQRGLAYFQGWIGRIALSPLARKVERELQLAGVLPQRPGRVEFRWIWPTAPHVDPKKESDAERVRIWETGSGTLSEAAASQGVPVDVLIETRRRDNERLRAAGLPEIQAGLTPAPAEQPVTQDELEEATEGANA